MKRNNVCSPSRRGHKYNGCFLDNELESVAKVFGLDNSKDIYKQLVECKTEGMCSLQDKFTVDQLNTLLGYNINKQIFKPRMGVDRWNWLSTSDIDVVMHQYMNFDNSFKYLGTFPSDIIELKYKLPKVDYYKKLGMILNLDTHESPGSHWVVIYVSKIDKTVEYFDSLGDPPTKNTKRVLDYLSRKFGYDSIVVSREFQLKNTECGIYSIYYLISRMLLYTSDEITSNIIRDSRINKYRNVLYM